MEKKNFKTETKKLLDMMINSIYTHKEIFLRELISNASDAIDKRHYLSLTNTNLPQAEYQIIIEADKDAKTLTIKDNGIGMTS
ncbi:MAG: molecular chaperone HtpG, partial [Acholeplasmatales bacterium]|nr:molecular chaperone HtpG [Acholeplasmatales bacterium]